MRNAAKLALCAVALLLGACGSDTEPTAGIEIGNPSVGLAAQFVLDYGNPDYSALGKLALSQQENSPLEITQFSLGLREVRHYSSYFTSVPVDPMQGLRVWPRGSADTVAPMVFAASGTSQMAFSDWVLPTGGLLKELSLSIVPLDGQPLVSGRLRNASGSYPFEFSLAQWASLQLRFHSQQLETINDSLCSLPVRFHVPSWIAGLSLDSVRVDSDGVVRFSPSSNVEMWEALNDRFSASFNSLRWQRTGSKGDTVGAYAPAALAQMDIPGRNWVRDTLFTAPEKHWILVKQLGGAATVRYSQGKPIVNVTSPGAEDFSVQLVQENIPLIAGKHYRISFKASASVNSDLMVHLGLYHSPYTSLTGADYFFGLYTGESLLEATFEATETNLFGRLEFNLGGEVRELTLSEIRVLQMD